MSCHGPANGIMHGAEAVPGNLKTERPSGEAEYLGSIPCITISSCLHSIMSFVNIAWKYGIEAAKTIRWALNLWSPIYGQREIQREILSTANTKPDRSLAPLSPCLSQWHWRHHST